MDESDRILGRLEEFKENALRRLDGIESKISELQKFKWRLAGGAAVLGVIVSLTIEIAAKVIEPFNQAQDIADLRGRIHELESNHRTR